MLTVPFLIIRLIILLISRLIILLISRLIILIILFVCRSLAASLVSSATWTLATFCRLVFGSIAKTLG